MRRGDVYWVNFEPARGGEVKKTRPAVIVSNNAAIRAQNRVQVVPVSSATGARIHRWEAPLRIHDAERKAMADQIRTVAKERLLNYECAVTVEEMLRIEQAIRVQLGLP